LGEGGRGGGQEEGGGKGITDHAGFLVATHFQWRFDKRT